MDWPDYLGDQATQYRRLAEKTEDPLIKQELLELAEICEEGSQRHRGSSVRWVTNSSGASKSLTFDFARTTTNITYTPPSSTAFFTVAYWNFFASALTCETCDRSLSVAFRAQLSWHHSPPIAGVRWYKITPL